MLVKWWFVCLIIAQVSTSGETINVNHLQRVEMRADGGCNVYQYYNPYVIESDWSCEKVSHSIADAIIMGCEKQC